MCEVGYQALSCFSMQWGTGWSLKNEAILQISNCAELVLRVEGTGSICFPTVMLIANGNCDSSTNLNFQLSDRVASAFAFMIKLNIYGLVLGVICSI